MENEKVCIIVPVYRVEQYLARCLDSILAQTYRHFEVVVVDDGSPDACPAICDDYAAKHSDIHVIHKANGGVAVARNAGLDWAYANLEFDWISFLDSDDYLHPQFLEILLCAARKFRASICSCVYTRTGEFTPVPENWEKLVIRGTVEQFSGNYFHHVFNIGVSWGRIYRKELFCTLRFPAGRYYEDGFTVYKALFAADSIAVVDFLGYCWFKNPESITLSKPTEKKTNDYIDAMLEPIEFARENGFPNTYKHEVENFFYRMEAHLSAFRKEKDLKRVNKRFRKCAREFIRRDPEIFDIETFDDTYKIVFSPVGFWLRKIRNKLKRKRSN